MYIILLALQKRVCQLKVKHVYINKELELVLQFFWHMDSLNNVLHQQWQFKNFNFLIFLDIYALNHRK